MNVVLYSREDCSYCTRAKMILATRNIPYKELKLNEDYTKEHLLELYPSATTFPVVVVDGFNIGMNAGASAGQTIFHCHIHLIPRRSGDVENPKGGIRHLIPGKGYYDAT